VKRSFTARSSDVFPSRARSSPQLSMRNTLESSVAGSAIWLDPASYGTHALRRAKHRRAAQLLRGHTQRESTLRYFVIEIDDAFETAEQTEV